MEQQSRRRRRPALSCVQCRRRKIKCDRGDPCAHCLTAKSQCTYRLYGGEPGARQESVCHPSTISSVPNARTISSPQYPGNSAGLRISLSNRDTLTPLVTTAITEGGEQGDLDRSIPNDTQPPCHTPRVDINVSGSLRRVANQERNSERGSTTSSTREKAVDLLNEHSALDHSHISLNKTRIVSSSHWKTTTQELAPVLSCYMRAMKNDRGASVEDVQTRAVVIEMGDLLRTSKDITKRIKMTRPSGSLADPDFGLINPTRELADEMTNLYFQSFESAHRILHVPTFWTEYKKYWEGPESAATALRLKVLLVVGLGSSLHAETNPDSDIRVMLYQWVQAAQSWLSGPLKKDRLSIDGLQIYCLTVLARQVFSIGGDLVWMSMGSLIHRAMQIGLHRDPKYLPPMSILQAEVRRRLWATIVELLVQSSLDSAMPPRISFAEFDTDPPSNVHDEELDGSTTTLEPHNKSTYTATSMQLRLLDSLPTRHKVVELLNGLNSEISYLDVLAITSDIMDGIRTNDEFLSRNDKFGATLFHRNLLDYLLRRFLLLLHCPFAVKARANPLFYNSVKVSIDAAMAIVSPQPDHAFSQLMVLGGGMFREGFRCAGSVISYEVIARAEAQRHAGTLYGNSHNIDYLKQAMHRIIDFSVKRIEYGETNIKGPMFLSMIMAHVAAIEANIPIEYQIARSGRESLEHCVDLLQKRSDAISLANPDNIGFTPTNFSEHDSYGLDFDLDFFLGDADFA
ncbi:hypothetical protein BKA67DRAFT_345316 [Truncatella angustata]|uniref:Zn(2)-C6 fungal-type domain-containing protein n=1 Tax=Truncatella angustata TaxID=152316 RepID=A0A9P8UGS9_9PEZI|nr:uncharacterized protein BKA67DRAFT_345316 [Truncatella angustata]KAH6652057.1 hypothetical protein BKA67DRAFT_345316 [Truncatella angustata]